METRHVSKPVAGLLFLLVLALLLALVIALYTRAFANPTVVTLETARVGLVMAPGNKVEYRGVEIGRVGSVEKTAGGAELKLQLSHPQRVPANVKAAIESSTVFGAKYVQLIDPASPAGRIAAGQVIDASAVTTEVNDLFRSLDHVLTTINVADLNSALTELADALQGRGGKLAQLASQADTYLTALQPSLPQLRTDLVSAAKLAHLGAEVSPQLLDVLQNATTTTKTITQLAPQLDKLLVDFAILGKSGSSFFDTNGQALVKIVRTLLPTTGTLQTYAPELPCFFQALNKVQQDVQQAIGTVDPGLRLIAAVQSPKTPYRYPEDLPKIFSGDGVPAPCSIYPYPGGASVPVQDEVGNR